MPAAHSIDLHTMRLDPAESVLLVVDVQVKLAAAMPSAGMASMVRDVGILLELARRLRIPVVASEQYPKGLGPTVPPIALALGAPGLEVHRFEKTVFDCTLAPQFWPLYHQLGRKRWIVAGLETHVCVWLTVHGLLSAEAAVHVPADAVLARHAADHAVGLGLMQRAGAFVTATETLVFDALGQAGTEDFKALSKSVRTRT